MSNVHSALALAAPAAWQRWAIPAGIVLAALALGLLAAGALVWLLKRWARRTTTHIDDAIAKHMPRPLRVALPLAMVRGALPLVDLPKQEMGQIRHALLVLIILACGFALLKAVRVFEEAASSGLMEEEGVRARAVRTQVRGVRNVADFVIVVLAVGFALTTFESVRQIGTGMLASAGLAGVVVGFAAQKTLATLLAGVQLTLSQRIRVDDVVIVENEWGTIEEIRLTYVVVRIWDKRRLVLPATYFIERPFQNWTRVSTELLGTVNLHLDYSVPVDAIREELKRILDESEYWDGETWGVQVTDADAKAMVVRPLVSAKDAGDQWNLRCEVREKLIAFVQKNYPDALPRLRGEVSGLDAA
jgi:small-conductance mechanosensitive channel